MSSDPIVAGTDGSAGAELAVDRAGELAQALGASVHVVAVLASASPPERAAAGGGVATAERGAIEQTQAGAKLVANSRDRLEARGVNVQTHVRTGDPAAELIKVAEAEHAQMIVVGNRGMRGARRMLGSVPNAVSHHARCGVLIVPTQP
jgi:nucleotide-binding universal stress UspA family protein